MNSNRFAIGEDSLQTSQDLQNYNTTLDGNEITHNTGSRPNNDDIDDKEDSEPNTIIDHNVKPSHKMGRGINLKYVPEYLCYAVLLDNYACRILKSMLQLFSAFKNPTSVYKQLDLYKLYLKVCVFGGNIWFLCFYVVVANSPWYWNSKAVPFLHSNIQIY